MVTLPVCYVADFVADLTRRAQRKENRGQTAIANFAASHHKELKPEQFLPWQVESKEVAADTLSVLRQLVDDGKLSPRAEAAARARLK